MLFHTPEFFVFLAAVLVFYYAFPAARIWLLAAGNALFYSATGPGYLALFFGVVSFTYLLSRLLNGKLRKPALALALFVVIGNLAFFKYSLFLLRNIEQLVGIHWPLADSFLAKVVLPVGISFYTFQLIAYLIDVYKGKLKPCRSLIEFWVFISYFAHSLAGPILRGDDFLPQLERIRSIRFSAPRFKLGLAYFTMGFFKKAVLADWITPYADQFFARAPELSGGEAWIAAYLFAFQIYFDFSAYSEMAVGIGHMMGIRLDLNFRTPYLSSNGSEFWRRWHITLSSWIRDYIYIPLGGSRRGVPRQYFNLLAAMAISGLWHGAAWTFVIWGLYHGVLQAAHKLYGQMKKTLGWTRLDQSFLYRVLSVFVFFHLVCISWVLFRVSDADAALAMIRKMLTPGDISFAGLKLYLIIAVGLYMLHIAEYVLRKHAAQLAAVWQRVPPILRGAGYTALIAALAVLMRAEQNHFIYFQF